MVGRAWCKRQMTESKIMRRGREETLLLGKNMKPEERLVAFLRHTQLVYKVYQAGVKYRAGLLPLRKRRISGSQ